MFRYIYFLCTSLGFSKVDLRHETEQINFYVSDMPLNACLAKLRHVAGWAVRKELERCRRFIRQNMFSQTTETRQNVYAAYAKCELLEERIIVQFAGSKTTRVLHELWR